MSAGRLMTAALLLVVATAGRASADWKLSDSVFPPEAPTQVTVGLGLDFNRGRFETEQTSKTASLTPLIRFESDNVAVRASLPLFRLEGPLEAGLDPPKGTEYGVGDLNMEIGYTVYPLIEGTPFFDFICRVKFPTADKDFGTGEFDVTLLTSAVQTIYRDFSAFADLGVRLRGGGAYDDTLLAAFGVGAQGSTGIGVWIVYDWREAPLAKRGDEHELTPFLSVPIGPHLRFDPYALVGLSEASPDWGAGVVVSWRF